MAEKKGSVCKGEGGPEDEGPLPFSASELLLKLFLPSETPSRQCCILTPFLVIIAWAQKAPLP